jgi:acetoacetyl-CoA synthetase
MKPLWTPTQDGMDATALAGFVRMVETRHNLSFDRPLGEKTYLALHQWSIDNKDKFWDAVWDFGEVIGEKGDVVLQEIDDVPWVKFFPGAKISYGENALRHAIAHPDDPAIIYRHQGGPDLVLSGQDLYNAVSRWEQALRAAGVKEGDAVGVYLTNVPETDIILLAASNIGATFCSAGMEMGGDDMINRFGKVQPKILVTAGSYVHGAKTIDRSTVVARAQEKISSIEKTIVLPCAGKDEAAQILGESISAVDFLAPFTPGKIEFIRRDFNHPLYVLFSSGSTGEPKCFVHGTGGVMLKHICEYKLQSDIRPGDRAFYHATPSWMMWNWAASSMLAGAVNLKYDGDPASPDAYSQLKFTSDHRATHHGTAAPVIVGIWMGSNVDTTTGFNDLSDMRTIMYTGAPLPPKGFEYIEQHIRPGVQVSSISGGTDLVGCFLTGNPFMPVYAGQTAAPVLGMDVQIWDEQGKPVEPGQPGELVCIGAFPSMPVRFLHDEDGARYRKAYFDFYAGRRAWRHGDTIQKTPQGQVFIVGRSDATLNQNGVRIGTGAIYNQLTAEKIGDDIAALIRGSTVIDFMRPSDQQPITVLFLHLDDWQNGVPENLARAIKKAVRENVGPYSVPTEIIAVPGVLRTKNGKLAEVVSKKVVNGAGSGQHIPNPSLYGGDLVHHYEEIGRELAAKYSVDPHAKLANGSGPA